MMLMPNYRKRKGFSLVELMVVSALMAVLALLISSAWVGVGRTAAGLIGRSQLVQERDLAVVALSRDLGGCLADNEAKNGEKINGRWLKWELPSPQELKLYYDGGTNSSGVPLANTVVQYLLATDPDPAAATLILVRRKTVSGGTPTDFTVARNVCSMTITPDGTPVNAVRIVICFKYRTLTLTCDMTARQPSLPSDQTSSWSIDHYTNP